MEHAFKLSNGDVISIHNDLYEFEDGLLYPVIEDKFVSIVPDEYKQIVKNDFGHWEFKRNSGGLTPEQVNEKYSTK